MTREPNCLECIHFKITWNKRFPRACTMFGIKTKNMPSRDVLIATGRQCPAFKLNPKVKKTVARPRHDGNLDIQA